MYSLDSARKTTRDVALAIVDLSHTVQRDINAEWGLRIGPQNGLRSAHNQIREKAGRGDLMTFYVSCLA